MSDGKEAPTVLGRAKIVAEICGIVGVGLFFAWRFATGWLDVNTDLEITSTRIHANSQQDFLSVIVGLNRGDYGSITLGDAQLRVSYFDRDGAPPTALPLFSTDRLASPGGKLDWLQREKNHPLRLHAHEKSQFAAVLKVPRDAVCILEAAFLFHRNFDGPATNWGQRRSSAISLPLQDQTPDQSRQTTTIQPSVPARTPSAAAKSN